MFIALVFSRWTAVRQKPGDPELGRRAENQPEVDGGNPVAPDVQRGAVQRLLVSRWAWRCSSTTETCKPHGAAATRTLLRARSWSLDVTRLSRIPEEHSRF